MAELAALPSARKPFAVCATALSVPVPGRVSPGGLNQILYGFA